MSLLVKFHRLGPPAVLLLCQAASTADGPRRLHAKQPFEPSKEGVLLNTKVHERNFFAL